MRKKPAAHKSTQPPAPKTHNVDRRADQIIESAATGGGDELLTTRELADFLAVSAQWVELGRLRGYGPRFTRLSPKMIRYRKSDVIAWLEARRHARTSEYAA